MLLDFHLAQTSITLRVKVRKADTGQGLTALTSASSGLIISTIASNEATATVYSVAGSTIETISTLGTFAAPTATKCRFKLVDDTNHPGTYEVQIADARFAVSSAKFLQVTLSGVTNMAECDVLIPLRTVDPYSNTFGLPGLTSNVPGAAGGLFIAGSNAATTFATMTVTGALLVSGTSTYTGVVTNTGGLVSAITGNITGNLSGSAGSVTAGVTLAAPYSDVVVTGTASAGGASTITLTGASATDSLYVGEEVQIVSGTGAGQLRGISAYVGSTKVATVSSAWTTAPDNTSVFAVRAIPSPAAGGSVLSSSGLDSIVVESGLNARQALSIIAASASGVLAGATTPTVTIAGAGVVTNRITGTVDGSGNRTAVVLSPPA